MRVGGTAEGHAEGPEVAEMTKEEIRDLIKKAMERQNVVGIAGTVPKFYVKNYDSTDGIMKMLAVRENKTGKIFVISVSEHN